MKFGLQLPNGESAQDFAYVHEATAAKIRAERTDEALTIIDQLWRGETVNFQGQHFQVENLHFAPPPVQQPRIPIWVAGWYPNKAPMRRAARRDRRRRWGERVFRWKILTHCLPKRMYLIYPNPMNSLD